MRMENGHIKAFRCTLDYPSIIYISFSFIRNLSLQQSRVHYLTFLMLAGPTGFEQTRVDPFNLSMLSVFHLR